MKLLK